MRVYSTRTFQSNGFASGIDSSVVTIGAGGATEAVDILVSFAGSSGFTLVACLLSSAIVAVTSSTGDASAADFCGLCSSAAEPTAASSFSCGWLLLVTSSSVSSSGKS